MQFEQYLPRRQPSTGWVPVGVQGPVPLSQYQFNFQRNVLEKYLPQRRPYCSPSERMDVEAFGRLDPVVIKQMLNGEKIHQRIIYPDENIKHWNQHLRRAIRYQHFAFTKLLHRFSERLFEANGPVEPSRSDKMILEHLIFAQRGDHTLSTLIRDLHEDWRISRVACGQDSEFAERLDYKFSPEGTDDVVLDGIIDRAAEKFCSIYFEGMNEDPIKARL